MFAHGQANATAIPKPHHFLPNLNPDWFTFRPTQVVLEKRLLNGCSSSSSKGGSVADSGAEGPVFKLQSRRYRVTVLGKLFTPIVPVFTKQQNWYRQQPS